VLAALMLCIFAFSVTPKIVLHDMVAHHKDTPFKSNFGVNSQFDKAGFNCNCDNLVVESPFTNDFNPVQISIHRFFPSHVNEYRTSFHSIHHFFSSLRGPPVLIVT
jgi:hypothetical protein